MKKETFYISIKDPSFGWKRGQPHQAIYIDMFYSRKLDEITEEFYGTLRQANKRALEMYLEHWDKNELSGI